MARLTLPAFGPALPPARPFEALMAALGAALALGMVQAVLWLLSGAGVAILAHPLVIAPLAASAVLIFAVPASPLAQPWSVVAGNVLAALVGLAVLHAGLPVVVEMAVAVLVALLGMALARCLHPPAGAVALATVLTAPAGLQASLSWLVLTVGIGSALLVAFGLLFHRATGRRYPFAVDPAPLPGPVPPSPLDLATALGQLRLEGTLGVDDLARLIATAEALTPHPALTAAQIMTPEPVTLVAQDGWREMSDLFVRQGCGTLPVVDGLGRYIGLIPVQHILRPGAQGLTARHLMETDLETATPLTGLPALLAPLARGRQTCLPVLEDDGSLCGVITRSDILAALLRVLAHPQSDQTKTAQTQTEAPDA